MNKPMTDLKTLILPGTVGRDPEGYESTHQLVEDGRVVAGCWLKAKHFWCDFKLFEVSGWTGTESGEPFISWAQVREGECRDLFDCQDMTKADPVIEGFIKWDGCIEFNIPQQHYCDGPESIAQLHRWFQWMLARAYEGMQQEGAGEIMWEPQE